ncbi:hypothetical protein HDU92_002560 [Lobulomyces angularis]|nr:hypothetical protein HDU92_002560 [Lobulomyces angularis]
MGNVFTKNKKKKKVNQKTSDIPQNKLQVENKYTFNDVIATRPVSNLYTYAPKRFSSAQTNLVSISNDTHRKELSKHEKHPLNIDTRVNVIAQYQLQNNDLVESPSTCGSENFPFHADFTACNNLPPPLSIWNGDQLDLNISTDGARYQINQVKAFSLPVSSLDVYQRFDVKNTGHINSDDNRKSLQMNAVMEYNSNSYFPINNQLQNSMDSTISKNCLEKKEDKSSVAIRNNLNRSHSFKKAELLKFLKKNHNSNSINYEEEINKRMSSSQCFYESISEKEMPKVQNESVEKKNDTITKTEIKKSVPVQSKQYSVPQSHIRPQVQCNPDYRLSHPLPQSRPNPSSANYSHRFSQPAISLQAVKTALALNNMHHRLSHSTPGRSRPVNPHHDSLKNNRLSHTHFQNLQQLEPNSFYNPKKSMELDLRQIYFEEDDKEKSVKKLRVTNAVDKELEEEEDDDDAKGRNFSTVVVDDLKTHLQPNQNFSESEAKDCYSKKKTLEEKNLVGDIVIQSIDSADKVEDQSNITLIEESLKDQIVNNEIEKQASRDVAVYDALINDVSPDRTSNTFLQNFLDEKGNSRNKSKFKVKYEDRWSVLYGNEKVKVQKSFENLEKNKDLNLNNNESIFIGPRGSSLVEMQKKLDRNYNFSTENNIIISQRFNSLLNPDARYSSLMNPEPCILNSVQEVDDDIKSNSTTESLEKYKHFLSLKKTRTKYSNYSLNSNGETETSSQLILKIYGGNRDETLKRIQTLKSNTLNSNTELETDLNATRLEFLEKEKKTKRIGNI